MNAFSSFFAVLMLSAGLFITVRLGFFQFTHFPRAMRAVLLPDKRQKHHDSSGGLTPFQAMAAALGGSVGTANIAGTAGALALGGPGAIFWMWTAAAVGMAVKFSEIVLAIRYRERRGGGYAGGPMHYIRKGLGEKCRVFGRLPSVLAACFAVFSLLSSLIGTPLVQANTIAESFISAVQAFRPEADAAALRVICGVLTASLAGIVVIGGVQRIGRISELIVPFMALAYIGVCAAVLVHFRRDLPSAAASVFKDAFSFRPAAGGIGGYAFITAMRVGTARGVYSNEAGVGSSPMAHACADTDDAVNQGFYGIFEVFADTMIMCTLTALAVLSSGVPLLPNGAETAFCTFSAVLGEKGAGLFLAVSLLLFAYTSIIGWSVYGLQCSVYLFGDRVRLTYCIVFTALTAAGAFVDARSVWRWGETLNYLMALPNMIAVLLLSGEVRREVRLAG